MSGLPSSRNYSVGFVTQDVKSVLQYVAIPANGHWFVCLGVGTLLMSAGIVAVGAPQSHIAGG